MVEKDFIIRVIENIFKFIRKLLKMDFRENQEEFIQESSDFLKNCFDMDVNALTEDSLENIYKTITDKSEQKKINIVLFRLSLAQGSVDFKKGKSLYMLFKKSFDKNNKTFFFTRNELDLEIDQLITENKKMFNL